MYFKNNKRQSALVIDDDFFRVLDVNDVGDVTLEFAYSVDLKDVFRKNATVVRLSILLDYVQTPSVVDSAKKNRTSSKDVIKNILNDVPSKRAATSEKRSRTVATKNSDVTSGINNEIIKPLSNRVDPSSIQQLYTQKLISVPAGQVKLGLGTLPIYNQYTHVASKGIELASSSSYSTDYQRNVYDSIMREGIDPSSVVSYTHRSTTAHDVTKGLTRKTKREEREDAPSKRVLEQLLSGNDKETPPKNTKEAKDSDYIQITSTEVVTRLNMPIRVILNRNAFKRGTEDNYVFFAKFDLLESSSGLEIDSVTKQLDVSEKLQLYYTPTIPPSVKITNSVINSKINLQIVQLDPQATSVKIFRKILSRASEIEDEYSFVGLFDVTTKNQSLLVPVDKPIGSAHIYRVIPIGSTGVMSSEFTNVVIRPHVLKDIKTVSLSCYITNTGIRVEVRKIPVNVTAIRILVRDVTKRESEFSIADNKTHLVTNATRLAGFINSEYTTPTIGHNYEFCVELIYKNGLEEKSGYAIIEFLQPQQNKVDTKITNIVSTETPSLNVSFDMNTVITDSTLDLIKGMLQNQGMYEIFKDQITLNRDKLKDLIAHSVERVDLTDGSREDFGVIMTTAFSDTGLRKNQSVKPLKRGHQYRYEVMPLLRSTETLLENYESQKVDTITKKSYTDKPAKFRHPATLRAGTLVTNEGLKSMYGKSQMKYGAIGMVASVDISFEKVKPGIRRLVVSQPDTLTNVLTWSLSGDASMVDHFMIMKEVRGIRTIVGKAHNVFEDNNFRYVHRLTVRDEGAYNYVIVPVYSDYMKGEESLTNVVLANSTMRFVKGLV